MGRKHKHEEHVNMEAWVISYADMVTLLFALFVVLYALGEIKLSKLSLVAKSMAFAFSFEGEGQTQEPGIHDRGKDGEGQVIEGAPLITSQKEAMKQFLERTLPETFKEQTGKSLEIVQTDSTISFKAPLSAYFNENEYSSLRSSDLTRTLSDLIGKTAEFTGTIRIQIRAPSVVIGRNANGTMVRSKYICHLRLNYLHEFVTTVHHVDHSQVITEFQYHPGRISPPGSPSSRGWEDRATLEIAFAD